MSAELARARSLMAEWVLLIQEVEKLTPATRLEVYSYVGDSVYRFSKRAIETLREEREHEHLRNEISHVSGLGAS